MIDAAKVRNAVDLRIRANAAMDSLTDDERVAFGMLVEQGGGIPPGRKRGRPKGSGRKAAESTAESIVAGSSSYLFPEDAAIGTVVQVNGKQFRMAADRKWESVGAASA